MMKMVDCQLTRGVVGTEGGRRKSEDGNFKIKKLQMPNFSWFPGSSTWTWELRMVMSLRVVVRGEQRRVERGNFTERRCLMASFQFFFGAGRYVSYRNCEVPGSSRNYGGTRGTRPQESPSNPPLARGSFIPLRSPPYNAFEPPNVRPPISRIAALLSARGLSQLRILPWRPRQPVCWGDPGEFWGTIPTHHKQNQTKGQQKTVRIGEMRHRCWVPDHLRGR